MKLKANQVAALEKIANAAKPGLPEKEVHFRVRNLLSDAGLIKVVEKKGANYLTVTPAGRKELKNAEKALATA